MYCGNIPRVLRCLSNELRYIKKLPTTINLWLISLTAGKELAILLLSCRNDRAIGIAEISPDFASVHSLWIKKIVTQGITWRNGLYFL